MGRKKIKIERISDSKSRNATFNKRKVGLMKKAIEISVLCDCKVALVVFGKDTIYQYSTDDMDALLDRYNAYSGPVQQITEDDLENLKPSKLGTKTSKELKRPRDSSLLSRQEWPTAKSLRYAPTSVPEKVSTQAHEAAVRNCTGSPSVGHPDVGVNYVPCVAPVQMAFPMQYYHGLPNNLSTVPHAAHDSAFYGGASAPTNSCQRSGFISTSGSGREQGVSFVNFSARNPSMPPARATSTVSYSITPEQGDSEAVASYLVANSSRFFGQMPSAPMPANTINSQQTSTNSQTSQATGRGGFALPALNCWAMPSAATP